MRIASLPVLLLGITALCAPAAQAQLMLPDKSPTKGQEGQLDTSCGAWNKNRKSMNYYLMMYVTENHLRTSVASIQDKQGIGGDPLKNVEEKDIAAWMDKFCGDKPDSPMQAAAEAYAKVLVEQMPASAKSEPRGGATAAAAAGATAGGTAAPAEKKSLWSFKVARTCESWVNGRKGLDYYLMMNSSGEYLKAKVEELRQARGVTKDPLQGVSDKDIARQLDEYCPRDLKQPLEAALDVYADRLVGTGTVAQPAAGGAESPKAAAQAPAAGAAAATGAAATAPAPRKPTGFAVNRTCDSWNSGRKSLDYYLLMSKSEDYLKAEVAALAAGRGVSRDPLQGVDSKQIAGWLDEYCVQRGNEPLEKALDAYANRLVGAGTVTQPRAEPPVGDRPGTAVPAPTAGAAAPAAAATTAPAPRKPSAFSVGRTCDSWNTGRKGLDYYLLMSKSEDYLKAEVAALAAERGVTRDPMQGVDSKQIAGWLDQYCAQRGKEPLETALNAYANELVGPGTAPRPTGVGAAPATPMSGTPPPQAAAKPQAVPAAPQAPREPAYLSGGRNCAAWSAGRAGQEYYNLIESSEAQLRSDVRVLRETRGLTYDPLESVTRKDLAAFLDGYCAERPKAPIESAVRVYANQLLSNK